MSALDDVLAQPTGARFLRADLHIHSYGASHDVRDASMTNAAIVQTAANEGLSIIASPITTKLPMHWLHSGSILPLRFRAGSERN